MFLNGLGRGCLPADHALFFSRARSAALKGADVALVIGVPLDFRLGFGAVFGEETAVVFVDAAEPLRASPRPLAGELYGALPSVLDGLRLAAPLEDGSLVEDRGNWLGSLRAIEIEARESELEWLLDERSRCIRRASTASLRRCSIATRS